MQLLLIHSDYMEYEVKKETKISENIEESKHHKYFKDILVIFVAIEKEDLKNENLTIQNAIEEINKIINMIHENNILLYPYAHISYNLASPNESLRILIKIEEALKRINYLIVERAPFGWYKSFSIKCKGHPLSELSKHITTNIGNKSNTQILDININKNIVSEALKSESITKSYWKILDIDGKLYDLEKFDFKNHHKLNQFINYEVSKNRISIMSPPHIELMKKLEIADYEPGSDSGNMRFYPNGRFIKSLIENYVIEKTTVNYGAMEVETPIMYDMDHPTIKKYLDRFPARQYSLESDKKHLFLRFAACFGQFLMNHDMTISYKHLPLKMIELTRYSFRKEQHGELVGLRRLRAFTMPDMHTLTLDLEEAKIEFINQYNICIQTLKDIGLNENDFEISIRFTKQFYEQNKNLIENMVKIINKPALIEMWDSRVFYFVLKFEFNYIDNFKKASALSTVQIDVENSKRYDIYYSNKDGTLINPVILHCSPSGSIERCIYAILEKAAFNINNKKLPYLPLWLSPTQIRLIPMSDKYINYAKQIVNLIKYRVDIDDRDLTLNKKIREAGTKWIPFIAVIGEKEVKSNKLSVTIRSKSSILKQHIVDLSIEELNNIIQQEIKSYPYKPLPLQLYLSKRPKFV